MSDDQVQAWKDLNSNYDLVVRSYYNQAVKEKDYAALKALLERLKELFPEAYQVDTSKSACCVSINDVDKVRKLEQEIKYLVEDIDIRAKTLMSSIKLMMSIISQALKEKSTTPVIFLLQGDLRILALEYKNFAYKLDREFLEFFLAGLDDLALFLKMPIHSLSAKEVDQWCKMCDLLKKLVTKSLTSEV